MFWDNITDYCNNPAISIQLIGGVIALLAAIFAIFYTDTINKKTGKLTTWGLISLIFLLLGAGINGSSKYYEIKLQRDKDNLERISRDSLYHVQDSVRNIQIIKLDSIKNDLLGFQKMSLRNQETTQESVSTSLNKIADVSSDLKITSNSINPIYPFSIKYNMAVDLSVPELSGLLPILQSKNVNVEHLSSSEIKYILDRYKNDALNVFTNILKEDRIQFTNFKQERLTYFCKRTYSYLSIQYSDKGKKYYLVDSSEYKSQNPPLGNKNIQNLVQLKGERYDLNIYKDFTPKIPKNLYPNLWSNVEVQFAKQPVFTIEKKVELGDYWWLTDYHFHVDSSTINATNLVYSLEKWDKVYLNFH